MRFVELRTWLYEASTEIVSPTILTTNIIIYDWLFKNLHFSHFGVSEINASEVFGTNLICTGFYGSTCKFTKHD